MAVILHMSNDAMTVVIKKVMASLDLISPPAIILPDLCSQHCVTPNDADHLYLNANLRIFSVSSRAGTVHNKE